ncbi:hypothetical protein C8R47DRAFT_97 [Mycena vitilis]|nr:hypothetical protein C8R47DRAFT_97 [Mycena vitilis]
MGQVFGALKFALSGALPDHLFAKLPQPDSDLTGRTFLVTGSNTGIGYAAVVHLARLNPAKIILGVRDVAKGEAAKTRLVAEAGFSGAVEVWEIDMADFASVKRFAARANSLERLDGALLNAGLNAGSWEMTGDAWERMLQVNALSTGLLALLLLPLLKSTAAQPDASPHLTITGSASMFFTSFPEKSSPNIIQTLNDPSKSTNDGNRYPTTKLFDLYIAREIARLPHAEGVVVNVVEPGFCVSELMREQGFNSVVQSIYTRIGWPCSKGALNLLYAVLKPTPPGAYVSACKIREPPPWCSDKAGLEVQRRVWHEMADVWRGVAPEVAEIIQF